VSRLAHDIEEVRERVRSRLEAQERFLSNVSHEIKTPISVMLTEAQTIDRSSLPPHGVKFVKGVAEEMTRLGTLVDGFLTLARVQEGKVITPMRVVHANDLVMDSVEDCLRMAAQQQVRLVPELLSDESTLDASVSGSPELLRTMLDNLVRNAIRFSPSGETIRVIAEIADNGRVVRLRVRDRGPGIPPDRIASIFDRFSQAPNQPRHGRGHGLGLSIALGISELHGGTIAAVNLPEGGCEFVVSLAMRHADVLETAPMDESAFTSRSA
jgi:signal transduction histidine kinase